MKTRVLKIAKRLAPLGLARLWLRAVAWLRGDVRGEARREHAARLRRELRETKAALSEYAARIVYLREQQEMIFAACPLPVKSAAQVASLIRDLVEVQKPPHILIAGGCDAPSQLTIGLLNQNYTLRFALHHARARADSQQPQPN